MPFLASKLKSLVSKKLAGTAGGTVLLAGMGAGTWEYVALWGLWLVSQAFLDWQGMKMGVTAPKLPKPPGAKKG